MANQKKESDLANTLAQWRKVEATPSSKDAEFTKLLSDNRRLDEDLTDLQGQLENVEGVLGDRKNQLSSEILRRVDLENQVHTLKEQLELQKSISEQEILEIRSQHESRLVELDSRRWREFDSKLAETMQQIRQENESQLQQYKDEIDKTFSSKLQNAQQAALEKNSVVSATKEELETTKLRVESLSSQLQQCQTDLKGVLGDRKNQLSSEILRRVDLENQVHTLKEQLELQKSISEQEILEIRSQHESRLVELDSRRWREFDSKLAETMQQIRQDHESQLQQYKEEIDKTFSSKLQNAQQAALEKNSVVSATKEELETTKLRVECLSSQLQQCQTDVEGVLGDRKNQLSSEILRRVDLENQVHTLKEQLELQKSISEQEILEIRSQHESRLVELDSRRWREFDSKLAETMRQIRQENESQLQQYKEEIDKTFSSKLQNAQQAALEKSSVVSATKEELETTKLRVECLSSQLQQCQTDKMVLESRYKELERTLEEERLVWHQRLSRKEQELLTMQSQMSAQLENYKNLLDVKLALDMEIDDCKKILEAAQQRLQLSPSPSAIPRTQHSAVHEHSSHKLRGKKRKHEGASGSSPACKMSSRSTAHSAVSVAEVDVDGKYVRLKNYSEAEQPLGGWVVRRTYLDSRELSFHIPSSCILAGGQTLTIWAAGAEAEADPGDLILQGHRSWVPVTDIRVVLLNPNHEEIAERRVCMQDRGDKETELDFDEEYVAGSDIQHFQRQPKRTKKCCSVS